MGVTMFQLTGVCTIAEFAEKHELDEKRLRRYIRNNDGAGIAVKFGTGKSASWVVNAEAEAPVLPTTRGRAATRDDGRRRYIVYMNDDELASWLASHDADTVIDTRERARNRRAAKRAAENDNDNE